MSIAYDTQSEHGGTNGSTGPLTWNHTIDGSAILIALCTRYDIDNRAVTVGGIAASELDFKEYNVGVSNVYLFGLLSPPQGVKQISADWDNDSGDAVLGAVSFQNVGGFRTGPFRTGGVATSSSLNVTPVEDGEWIVDAIQVDTAVSGGPSKNAAQSYGWRDTNPDGQNSGGMSYHSTPTASTNMQWTFHISNYSQVAVILEKAIPGGNGFWFWFGRKAKKLKDSWELKNGIYQPEAVGVAI